MFKLKKKLSFVKVKKSIRIRKGLRAKFGFVLEIVCEALRLEKSALMRFWIFRSRAKINPTNISV